MSQVTNAELPAKIKLLFPKGEHRKEVRFPYGTLPVTSETGTTYDYAVTEDATIIKHIVTGQNIVYEVVTE